MLRSCSSRWRALAVLPVLMAVLLMHGLDVRAGFNDPAAADGTSAAHVDGAADVGATHQHDSCPSCSGAHHVLVACVAIVATIAAWAHARRTSGRLGGPGRSPGRAAAGGSPLPTSWMPPEPAWVRLCVMRC